MSLNGMSRETKQCEQEEGSGLALNSSKCPMWPTSLGTILVICLCEVSRHSFPGDLFATGYLPKWLQWRWLGLRSHETRERSNTRFIEIVFHEWKSLHLHGSCAGGSLRRNFTVLCSAPAHTILSKMVLIFLCFLQVSWDSPILHWLPCNWIPFTFWSLFDQSTVELQSF